MLPPRRYKGAKGGRGSAKSHWFAEQAVVDCITRPTRFVGIREIQKSLDQSSKQLIEDKIRALGVESRFRILGTHIEVLDPPGILIFQGMQNHTAESIKSLEGYSRAWVEEASALSQRSLDLLTPTIRAPGSELWFSWNPDDPDDPVDQLFDNNAGDPDFECITVTWRDNPWFPPELRRDMERDQARDPEKAKHVWEGDYAKSTQKRVFHNWRVEPFQAPADAIWRLGADWGFANDPTVLVKACIDGERLLIREAVSEVRCEVDETPGLFAKVSASKLYPITADPARPEMISYMRRAGFKMREAIKGPGSIEEGVRFLQGYDIIVHPDCDSIVAEELKNYSFKVDPHTQDILPVLDDKWNNCIDALRYACEAVRRAGKPAVAKPTRNPHDPPDLRSRRNDGESWKVA